MLFIFDFDSTLAQITGVDWKQVKKEVIEYGEGQGYEVDPEMHLVTLANHLSDTDEHKAEIDRIFRKYEKEAVDAGAYYVFEETIPLLQTLRDMGHKVAIASNNTQSTLEEIVEATGIPADAVMGRTSVFHPKPFPDMLNKLMEQFKSTKSETFMTGDNFWDEGAGKAAGVKTFIIKPGTLDISLFDEVL